MKKLLVGLFSGLVIAFAGIPAKAEIDIGVTLQVGKYETSGSEKEKNTVGDTETNTKSVEETFYGGSVYIEAVSDSGFAIGIDWVPMDIELGSGKRTDSAVATAVGGAENDTGDRSASADLTNLITVYANVPIMGSSNFYGLLGVHHGEVVTSETLQTSSYGNDEILGYQIGLGYKTGKLKTQVYYSDFGDVSMESDQGDGTKVEASADVLAATLSYGF